MMRIIVCTLALVALCACSGALAQAPASAAKPATAAAPAAAKAPAAAAAPAAAKAPAAAAKAKPAPPSKNVYQTQDSYTAAYHYLTCATTAQAQPASTAEVAALVAKHYQSARASGAPVTLRTSRPRFHSTASFVCPTGTTAAAKGANSPAVVTEAGAKQAAGASQVGVLQSQMNKVLAVDAAKSTMRVQAGTTIAELLKAATKNKMSVQIGSVPAYAELTLGGVLATSAHGSGDQTVNSLADTVLEVTWVDGTGKAHTSKKGDPEFAAFNGGLGVFGIITELLIQLTPPTNTQLITVSHKDKDMMADLNNLLKVSPHILIHWRPDEQEYKAFLTRKAPAAGPGSKVNTNPAINMAVLPNTKGGGDSKTAFNVWHTTTEDDSSMMDFLCPLVRAESLGAAWAKDGPTMEAKKLDNVTAPTNQLMAAECDEDCLWNNGYLFNGTAMDAEFTIEFEQLASWIADVKKIFQTELWEGGKKKYRCLGLGYIWIRFGSGYDGVTATPTGMKRPVYVQSTWMRSRDAPHFPMRFQYIVDLVEEVTLCKYKGRPHPGKNFDRTFLHPKCPVAALYPKFPQLVALSKKHDPAGMLKPRLFDRMAARGSYDLFPHCAALMKCYCSADVHCRPEHKCVPSLTFPEFKVCKPTNGDVDKPGTLMQKIVAK